jgi:hypothetical protein
MRGKPIALSPMRRFVTDLLHFASAVPTVPVERHIDVGALTRARAAAGVGVSWTAIFLHAYSRVTAAMPQLRRAYIKLPWPHLYEYPTSVVTFAVERSWRGEPGVFFGRVKDPATLPLAELDRLVRYYQQVPIELCKPFRQALRLGALPRPARRLLWWLGLNLGRQRANFFGTFSVTAYSALGAASLHPLSPATTTLTYGVIGGDGSLPVRVVYDHRVLDGADVARALARLEQELHGETLAEMWSLAGRGARAA